MRLSAAQAAALPPAIASNAGALTSVHGVAIATPRASAEGVYSLRLPFMFVPKAISDVRANALTLKRVGTTSAGTFTVRNWQAHRGDADVFQWALTDPAGDVSDPDVADIVDVGVASIAGKFLGDPTIASTDQQIVFAVNMARGTSTQAIHEIDVYFDTDGDGTHDFVTVMADFGLVTAGEADGTLGSFTFDLTDPTQPLVDVWSATGPANGSVVEMPVLASALGLSPTHGQFRFSVQGRTILHDAVADRTSAASFNPYKSAVTEGARVASLPKDKQVKVPVTVDLAQAAAQRPLGWLVVTLDDMAGLNEGGRVRLPG